MSSPTTAQRLARLNLARLAVAAAVLVPFAGATVLSGSAWAQENGIYIGGGAGYGFTMDTGVKGGGRDDDTEFDGGLAGIGSVGYGFGNGLRAELELGYRENDVDSIEGANAAGDVEAFSAMANVAYDINLGGRVTPSVGAGVGLANIDANGVSPITGAAVDDDDTVLAYQALAGVAVGLTDQLKLTFDYRFLNTDTVELTASNGTNIDANYRNHSLMVGLRFSFGAPPAPPPAPAPVAQAEPAPPPPAPPPAPTPEPEPVIARNFLVFFDFDQSNLTADAQAIVAAAAEAAERGAVARIVATGHADTSGPADYNTGLSQRRADAVRAELVRLGIGDGDIATRALGETDPLVPTPDGVREPQNRRVEIVLQ